MRSLKFTHWLVLFVAAPMLAGCQSNSPVRPDAAIGTAAASAHPSYIAIPRDGRWQNKLTFATVGPATLHKYVRATGQLQPDASQVSRIMAPIKGKVDAVDVSMGQQVSKGQRLMTLSSNELTTLQADCLEKEAQIDADMNRDLLDIDCDLKQTEAQIGLLQKQNDRAKLLYEEKIGSLSQLEQAATELQKQVMTKQALLEKRLRTIKAAGMKKDLAHKALSQQLELLGMAPNMVQRIVATHEVECSIPIQTPQSGIVLERSVNPGELVESGKPLFLVDDLDTIWLVADIYEQDVDKVHVGQDVAFTVDCRPSYVFHAKLDFVSGSIDPDTRTLAVRASIANPRHELKPKMFARMNISVGQDTALAIPRSAIQELGSRKVVYIPRGNNEFEERTVQLGEASGDMIEVVNGLKSGEQIVADGSFMLRAVSLKQSN